MKYNIKFKKLSLKYLNISFLEKLKTKNTVNLMGICDICGRSRPTRETNLEGAIIEACDACVPHKKKESRPNRRFIRKASIEKRAELPRVNFEFVDDFGNVMKNAREKADITQKDLALKLNEQNSIINKIEQSKFKPRIGLAKKIEKILKIRIITKIEQLDKDGNVVNNRKDNKEDDKSRKDSSERKNNRQSGDLVYTLADVIKIKKKKKKE